MIFELYRKLYEIALKEFDDIVVKGEILKLPSGVPLKLRLYLLDGSFVDVWISKKKYSYHWQRDDLVFRHNNAPHERWSHVKTFPKHFHNSREDNVKESYISDNPGESYQGVLVVYKKRNP